MTPTLYRDPDTRYHFGGIIGEYIAAVSESWLKVMLDRNPRLFNDIRTRNDKPDHFQEPWAGEFTGKHLTGAVEVYRITRDPALREHIVGFVSTLSSLQAENGYLGVFPDEYEMTGKQPVGGQGMPAITCDTWNHYHIMLGLITWYRESGDNSALRTAARIADLLCDKFLGKPGSLAEIGVREFNLSPVHALALLYSDTGEQRYLDLALQIVNDEFKAGWGDQFPRGMDFVDRALEGQEYFENESPGGPRWECMHALMGLSELYRITGDCRYRNALEHIWWSMLSTDRHNNGGWGSMEQAFGSPYEVRSMELCCVVAWIALSVEVLCLSGDSVVADEIELAFLNFVLGYQSRSGLWAAYNVPSDGRVTPAMPQMGDPRRPDDEEICCCTVNGPRGFGLLSAWAVLCNADGLVLNWYGPSAFTVRVGDMSVSLTQRTDYPRTGSVKLLVEPERPSEFTVSLRIPHWSSATSVSINGVPVTDVPCGRYLQLRRVWKPGDIIDLELDMSLHYWVGENEVSGRTSVYRGPVLLTYPRRDPSEYLQFRGDWSVYFSARHTPYVDLYGSNRPGDSVVYEFDGESVTWLYNAFEDCGKAEVKIDGQVVAVVDQYSPSKYDGLFDYAYDKPNLFLSASWNHKGMTPGRHTMEITVLPERNDDSAGHRINIRELVAAADDPVFDAHTMECRALDLPDSGLAMTCVECTDVQGRSVKLYDIGSAADGLAPYISWLNVRNAPRSEFSRSNPTRSGRV